MLFAWGMGSYPVQLEVSSPPKFERIQLLIRFAIAVTLGWLGVTMGWLTCLLFLALPIIAAVVISTRGADYYLNTTGAKLWPALSWLLSFSAYMILLTDEVPVDSTRVRTELHVSGRPTIGSALLRVVMSLPSVIALWFVGFVSCVLFVVAVFSILFTTHVPASILSFQAGYLRWQARLVAYHASLVEEYPPFSLHDPTTKLPTAMVNP
ncbi:MAG TPA: DUF4389 domain-containing protein [Kofleriaceae bacterium]